jgi:uncharacterized RDD family membrane protein YckC
MNRQTNDMTAGVVTGEAVELDIRLARWPSRLLGQLIDLAVEFAALGALGALIAKLTANTDSDADAAIVIAVFVAVFFGYPVAMETLAGGRTLGKLALGLRVVRDDGAPERFRQALFRALMFLLVDWWGPGLVVSILSDRSKRIGDLVAGTIVIQDRLPGGSVQPSEMPPQLVWWAGQLDLARLDDELALSVRQFLNRQHEMHAAAREALGGQLVAAVSAKVWPPPPGGTPGWAYLSAVLAERRRRATPPMPMQPAPWGPPPVAFNPQPPAVQPPAPSYQPAPQQQPPPGPFAPPA